MPKSIRFLLPNHFLYQIGDGPLTTVFTQFNPNPQTDSSVGTFFIYASDKSHQFLPGGMYCRFDYDYRKDEISRCWESTPDCHVDELARSLSKMRGEFAREHAEYLQAADERLQGIRFDFEPDGRAVYYHDVIPGPRVYADKIEYAAGLFFVHDDAIWTVFDMHCSSVRCNCQMDILEFNSGETRMLVDNHWEKPHVIREITGGHLSRAAGKELIQSWLEHKPIWFTTSEMKSRTTQTRTIAKRSYDHPSRTSDMEKSPSRNSLCPCGSGKKYKHCCMNQ